MRYDLAVVGSGVAAFAAAITTVEGGASVIMIERGQAVLQTYPPGGIPARGTRPVRFRRISSSCFRCQLGKGHARDHVHPVRSSANVILVAKTKPDAVAHWVRRTLPYIDAEHIVLALDCGMKRRRANRLEGRLASMIAAPQTLRGEVT